MPDLADRVIEIARDVAHEVAQQIRAANPHEVSATIAARIETRLRFEMAGDRGYISSLARKTRQQRTEATAAEVRRLFNGRNATELARQLGIGRATVYRILKTPGQ